MAKDGHMIEPVYLRAFAVVILLLVATIVIVSALGKKERDRAFAGIKNPMMTLELPRQPDDVKDTVGDLGDERRALMLKALTPDGMLFIPSYTFLFLGLSWLLSQRRLSWALWVAVIAGLCAVGAAAMDYTENANIRALLGTAPAETTQQMIDAARRVSLGKWALSFITTGLLSSLFLWRRDAVVVLGGLYALTALVGLSGLIYRPAIGWAFGLMGLGTIFLIILFLFLPGRFLQGL
ncbi:MAG TPA: hypothetical protein VGC87_22805 [Pyrinomonadaceae bacterium]|jgi:hypothetical protein